MAPPELKARQEQRVIKDYKAFKAQWGQRAKLVPKDQ